MNLSFWTLPQSRCFTILFVFSYRFWVLKFVLIAALRMKHPQKTTAPPFTSSSIKQKFHTSHIPHNLYNTLSHTLFHSLWSSITQGGHTPGKKKLPTQVKTKKEIKKEAISYMAVIEPFHCEKRFYSYAVNTHFHPCPSASCAQSLARGGLSKNLTAPPSTITVLVTASRVTKSLLWETTRTVPFQPCT